MPAGAAERLMSHGSGEGDVTAELWDPEKKVARTVTLPAEDARLSFEELCKKYGWDLPKDGDYIAVSTYNHEHNIGPHITFTPEAQRGLLDWLSSLRGDQGDNSAQG